MTIPRYTPLAETEKDEAFSMRRAFLLDQYFAAHTWEERESVAVRMMALNDAQIVMLHLTHKFVTFGGHVYQPGGAL